MKTLVDVGFAYGSPDFYEMFEADRLLCVDALTEYEPFIEPLRDRYESVEFACTALGSTPGELALNVSSNEPTKSSLGSRVDPQAGPSNEQRLVPVTTLDALCDSHALDGPLAVKIDTEGWELEILRGADTTLELAKYLVLETSVLPRFANGYNMTDMVCFLADRGFTVAAVLSARPRRDGRIPYADLLFESGK